MYSTHQFIRRALPLLAVVYCVSSVCHASGLLLIKDGPSSSEANWKPVPYASITQYAFSFVIQNAGGKETTFPKTDVAKVIDLPDLAHASIVSSGDATKITSLHDELVKDADRYTASSSAIRSLLAEIDGVLSKYRSGNVLVSGTWMTRVEYDQKVKDLNNNGDTLPELTFHGKTLKNVRVTGVRSDRISIMHDGGIATLTKDELTAEQLKRLTATAPSLFQHPSALASNTSLPSTSSNGGSEKLLKAREDLAVVLKRIEGERARYNDAVNTINTLTNNKRSPVVQGSWQHLRCLEAAKVITGIEREAPNLTAERDRLQSIVQTLEQIPPSSPGVVPPRVASTDKTPEVKKDGAFDADYNATAINRGALLTGIGLSLEKDRLYSMQGLLVMLVQSSGIAASIDRTHISVILRPQQEEGFSDVANPVNVAPVDFVGTYLGLTDGVPEFKCVLVRLNRQVVYKHESHKDVGPKSASTTAEEPATSAQSAINIAELKAAAENGDLQAQVKLGACYALGQSVIKDSVEAARWYRKAAEAGLASAQFQLGVSYEMGAGVPKDMSEAVVWYLKGAQQGYALAQSTLGRCYIEGTGVPKNTPEAMRWYRLAAEQGMAEAQYNLGVGAETGEGAPKDLTDAAKWYHLAAEQGYAQAQYNLGGCYALGNGVAQNYIEAYRWYTLALGQGVSQAGRTLATLQSLMTAEQMAEGKRLALDFKPHKKDP